jgi:phage antirepressor YoqD-like protein
MSDTATVDLLTQAVETIQKLTSHIETLQVPAELGKAVMEDSECYPFREAAKILTPKLKEKTGVEMGQNRLFETLRAMKVLQSSTSHWNEPYQQYAHFFKLVIKDNEHAGVKVVPLFTGKGLAWILPKLVGYFS